MTLFVYKYSERKPSLQPSALEGTKLNTCNTESPRGLRVAMTNSIWYFEVEDDDLYYPKKEGISGFLRKGPLRFEVNFPSLFMMKHDLLKLNKWKFGV